MWMLAVRKLAHSLPAAAKFEKRVYLGRETSLSTYDQQDSCDGTGGSPRQSPIVDATCLQTIVPDSP